MIYEFIYVCMHMYILIHTYHDDAVGEDEVVSLLTVLEPLDEEGAERSSSWSLFLFL